MRRRGKLLLGLWVEEEVVLVGEDLWLSFRFVSFRFFGPGPGEALWMLDGPWRLEYTVQTSMTAFFGLLFLSSFAMRLLDGSAKAYGDEIGSNGTYSRLIDCMFCFLIGDDFVRCECCLISHCLMRRENSQRRCARSTYLNNEEALSDHVAHSQQTSDHDCDSGRCASMSC